MDEKCKICGKPYDLTKLVFRPEETDADEIWSTYVCGSCWEIIATIARRTYEFILVTTVKTSSINIPE